jgi:peroxiredoxin Q/BCP
MRAGESLRLTESTTPSQASILPIENAAWKASKGRHMARKALPPKQSAAKKPIKKPAKNPEKKASTDKSQAPSGKLAAGAKAPSFNLPRDGGASVSLADFAGQNLVLYFYPRADTPGCTKEAIGFSRLRGAFAKANTQILGVSADPVPAQDKFKAKHKLSIALASDEQHRMIENYGIWQEKSLYGRKFMGIVRATFLIGPDQRIARVWPKVSVDGHADEVLAAAKEL